MIEEGKPAPTSSVPEAELTKTEAGLIVEGEGWKVELEEGCCDTGGTVQLIGACGEEIPLSTARAYAMALLAACDSVEGFTTTG